MLVGYVPLGDPKALEHQAEIYLECGVDVIEVGIPFADPFMDGKLVAESMARALAAGVSNDSARTALANLRNKVPEAPLLAMGYEDLTPIVRDAEGRALADGILHVGRRPADLNPGKDIVCIGFVSNRVSADELLNVAPARGYIMLQANEGKTGLRDSLSDDNRQKIQRVRSADTRIPILLGIGVSSAEQAAKAIALGADGVIIGSACLQAAQAGEPALRKFLRGVRSALNEASAVTA